MVADSALDGDVSGFGAISYGRGGLVDSCARGTMKKWVWALIYL
jgi:hypothetical protein